MKYANAMGKNGTDAINLQFVKMQYLQNVVR